jgi:hypothetical protein
LFGTLADRGVYVRKQFAEFFPLLSAGGQSGVTLEQEAEIVP